MLSSLLKICGIRGVVIHLFFYAQTRTSVCPADHGRISRNFHFVNPYHNFFCKNLPTRTSVQFPEIEHPFSCAGLVKCDSAQPICDFVIAPAGHDWPWPYFRSVLAYGIFFLLLATGESRHMFPKLT